MPWDKKEALTPINIEVTADTNNCNDSVPFADLDIRR